MHKNLLQFIKQHTKTQKVLKPTTRVNHDLGLDGDDALEFMQAYAETFNVDLTNFAFKSYFGEEKGINPVALIRYLLKGSELKPLTIEMLMDASISKVWPA
ncbi:MAG TPA: hypothetical protein DHW71_06870 [Gammaproteobacteria bacterium]|nr:hypothetical protein [Gammaproteobacteria bacterium]HBF07996.1 hypothetical protein [Gammaproteobacteria bacterium]HCK92688.1 hypothetical protein [Gammaproteobacteria bacterium]|tara:strand:- start:1110 stop:1412 length:303 start_codon:yes stop_codon:yes gene_type:complete